MARQRRRNRIRVDFLLASAVGAEMGVESDQSGCRVAYPDDVRKLRRFALPPALCLLFPQAILEPGRHMVCNFIICAQTVFLAAAECHLEFLPAVLVGGAGARK